MRHKGWSLTRLNHNGQFVFRWYVAGVRKTRRVPTEVIGQRAAMDWVNEHVFGIRANATVHQAVHSPKAPALAKVHQLIRLANGNGGSEEEARTAALAAVRLIAKHDLKLTE